MKKNEIDGQTRMAAVIGNPIKHSLSPFIHNMAFEELNLNATYLAWEVLERDMVQVLHNIRSLDMLGVNISMPYKQLAMWYPGKLSDSAQLIGAINTIVNEKGSLKGYNTDGLGFFRNLDVKYDFQPADKNLSVIGGGGAALAIIVEAARGKANKIQVFARRSRSFAPLKKKLETIAELTKSDIQLFDLYQLENMRQCLKASDLLVNASSVGMDGLSSPVPTTGALVLPQGLLVADVIYKCLQTPFLKWAETQGAKTENGLGMLLYQAAESFKLWTGKRMPVDLIEKKLKQKLYDV
ncbi:MAG: shikimate dehydrogenase [Streptococcaceae bacterium]|jgi:shikimate dehydrogenase|nr:shikimate dehydrogenase [Streptococcaceae bacterium]